jgi:hypothetical protein
MAALAPGLFAQRLPMADTPSACFFGNDAIATTSGGCPDAAQAFVLHDSAAYGMLQSIADAHGLQPNFRLVPCPGIKNFVARADKGIRNIYFDPDYINGMKLYSQQYWATMGVFAHELLHHYNNHMMLAADFAARRRLELEADNWSGRTLAMLSASLTEAQSCLELVEHPVVDSLSTHPSKDKRLKAIEDGYGAGKKNAGLPKKRIPVSELQLSNLQIITLKDIRNDLYRQTFTTLRGYEMQHFLYLNGEWFVFAKKVADYGALEITLDQARKQGSYSEEVQPEGKFRFNNGAGEFSYTPYLPKKKLDSLAARGSIKSVIYQNDTWYVSADSFPYKLRQQVVVMPAFDDNEINLAKSEGRMLRHLARGQNEWLMVFENTEDINCLDQFVLQTDTFPKHQINKNNSKGFRAVICQYSGGKWITVFQKFDTGPILYLQQADKEPFFPIDKLKEYESRGFNLQMASYDGKEWAYILYRVVNNGKL